MAAELGKACHVVGETLSSFSPHVIAAVHDAWKLSRAEEGSVQIVSCAFFLVPGICGLFPPLFLRLSYRYHCHS